MAPGKKRSYKEAFLRWGFTSIIDKSIEKPQCVLCSKVLRAEIMKPSKLKDYFEQEQEIFIRPKNNKTEYSTQKPYNILHLCRHKKTKW